MAHFLKKKMIYLMHDATYMFDYLLGRSGYSFPSTKELRGRPIQPSPFEIFLMQSNLVIHSHKSQTQSLF